MPLLGGEDAEFTAAMLAAAQETTSSGVSPWQQTSTAARDAGWALTTTTATATSSSSAAAGDAFWSGIDPDILGVPYVDAVQAEEEAKDRQRREAYKAWLDYQLVAAGKKKKDTAQAMASTTGTSSLAASLTGSLSGLGNSLRGSSLSPTRVTTTIADGKPVIIRPSTALSMFDDDDGRRGDDQTDTDAMPNEIDDADWDSDAEGANTGKWEKGEWVPIVKPKKTWWDPAALAQQLAAEKEEKAKKRVVEEQQQWKNAKIIRITDNWLHEETKRTVEDLKKTQKRPEDYEQALLASIRQKQLDAEEAAAAEAEAKRANSRSRSLRNSVMLEDGTVRKSRSKSSAAKSDSQGVFSASDFLSAPSGLDALPNTPFVAGDELGGGEGVGGDGDDGGEAAGARPHRSHRDAGGCVVRGQAAEDAVGQGAAGRAAGGGESAAAEWRPAAEGAADDRGHGGAAGRGAADPVVPRRAPSAAQVERVCGRRMCVLCGCWKHGEQRRETV